MSRSTTAEYQPAPEERERASKMVDAIIRSIIDESPALPGEKREVVGDATTVEVERVARFDEPLAAMAYVMAGIGVQSKMAENRIAIKRSSSGWRTSSRATSRPCATTAMTGFFGKITGTFRTDLMN